MSIGKIYKLFDLKDKDLVYYGSTYHSIYDRLKQHVYHSNKSNLTSKHIINKLNYDIVELERHIDIDKSELLKREAYYIKNYPCINKRIETQTREEYYKNNHDTITKKKRNINLCPCCNSGYRHDNKSHHNKTIKHKNNKEIYDIMNVYNCMI
jgi:hypothetical protein